MREQVCLAVAMLVASSTALAQSTAPPVKMGLWQTTSIVTMTGLQLPPDVAARLKAMGRPLPGAEPRTVVTESCLTPDSWTKMTGDMQQKQDCTFTSRHVTAKGMSTDMACRMKDSQTHSTGHVEISFLSPEKMHGTTHIKAISASRPQPIEMNMDFESVYRGADCHGIAPGSGNPVR